MANAGPLIVTRTTPAIALPDAAERARIAALPPTPEEHDSQFAACACLHELELAPPPGRNAPLHGPARIVFWNAERGKFLVPSAALLGRQGAAAQLLCELDLGMARSGQAHTARELAGHLGAGYVFGTEFVELGLGDAWERGQHAGAVNTAGLHGTAILSPFALERPGMVRLPADGGWFDGTRGERRVGSRIALLATLWIDGRPVTLADVHLESHSDPQSRAAQMALLLAAIDAYGVAQPVLIGGDFNTSTASRGHARGTGERPRPRPAERLLDPVPFEPLFELAAAAGYDWRACNTLGVPSQRTRPDGTPPPPLGRLDWFFSRGLLASDPQTVPAVDAAGVAISDHEALTVAVEVA